MEPGLADSIQSSSASNVLLFPAIFVLLTQSALAMGSSQSRSQKQAGQNSKTQTAIDIAIEAINISKGVIPFEPAKGALESLGVLLRAAQVLILEFPKIF